MSDEQLLKLELACYKAIVGTGLDAALAGVLFDYIKDGIE